MCSNWYLAVVWNYFTFRKNIEFRENIEFVYGHSHMNVRGGEGMGRGASILFELVRMQMIHFHFSEQIWMLNTTDDFFFFSFLRILNGFRLKALNSYVRVHDCKINRSAIESKIVVRNDPNLGWAQIDKKFRKSLKWSTNRFCLLICNVNIVARVKFEAIIMIWANDIIDWGNLTIELLTEWKRIWFQVFPNKTVHVL